MGWKGGGARKHASEILGSHGGKLASMKMTCLLRWCSVQSGRTQVTGNSTEHESACETDEGIFPPKFRVVSCVIINLQVFTTLFKHRSHTALNKMGNDN
jgi:hypothetical protein